MANKFLDTIGLGHLWLRIKENFVKKEEGKGLSSNDFTNDLLNKLNGIAEGANKYEHPTYTVRESGFYKVEVDSKGHVVAVEAVTKEDVTALGIPGQDTVYTHPTHSAYASDLYKITVDAEGHVTNAAKATSEDLKGVIGKIAEGDLDTSLTEKVNAAAEGNHSHANKDVLDGITEDDIINWDSKAPGDHNHDSVYAPITHGHEISAVSGLQDALNNRYTKEEVNGLVSSALHYMGTKDSYSDLPTDAKIGDVWNITNADSANGIKAGDNVAWNGTGWDILAGTVDLSAYYTGEQVDGKLADYVLATTYNTYVTEHGEAFEAVKATADAAATPDYVDQKFALARTEEQVNSQIDSKIAALELGALDSAAIDAAIRAVDSEAILG